jgi:hypothetical protein
VTEVNYPVDISAQDTPERAGLPSAFDPSLLGAKPPAQTLHATGSSASRT